MDEVSVLDPAPFPVQNLQNLEILKTYHEGLVQHLNEQESKIAELRELKQKCLLVHIIFNDLVAKLQKKRTSLQLEIKQLKKKPKTLRDVLIEQSELSGLFYLQFIDTEPKHEISEEVYDKVIPCVIFNN